MTLLGTPLGRCPPCVHPLVVILCSSICSLGLSWLATNSGTCSPAGLQAPSTRQGRPAARTDLPQSRLLPPTASDLSVHFPGEQNRPAPDFQRQLLPPRDQKFPSRTKTAWRSRSAGERRAASGFSTSEDTVVGQETGRSSRLLQPLDAASRMRWPTFPCVGRVITPPKFLLKSYDLVPRTVTLYGKRVFCHE